MLKILYWRVDIMVYMVTLQVMTVLFHLVKNLLKLSLQTLKVGIRRMIRLLV